MNNQYYQHAIILSTVCLHIHLCLITSQKCMHFLHERNLIEFWKIFHKMSKIYCIQANGATSCNQQTACSSLECKSAFCLIIQHTHSISLYIELVIHNSYCNTNKALCPELQEEEAKLWCWSQKCDTELGCDMITCIKRTLQLVALRTWNMYTN